MKSIVKDIEMRLGIVYSTPEQRQMIESMIRAAVSVLIDSGWKESDFDADVSDKAIEAIARIVKRSMNTESDSSAIDPMLIFDIGQNRG